MNTRCYKTVFSKRLGARVAVGEHASSQGKATGASAAGYSPCSDAWAGSFWGALSSTFALVALVWATPAWAQPAVNALPTGGQVVQGAVQFTQSAQQLNINQSTDRAAINWQSFDIGAAAKVNIQQPSAQSVLLNRVGGESPSQIFGQLNANGQVILVNPNGMVFGKDGSVSAAGFTGSTLNISDADFMAGKAHFTRQGTAASTSAIVNRGLIQAAPGGYVALLGASVSNEGRIIAPQGNVFMAAADAVTLPTPTVGLPIGQSGRIKLELTPASINAAVANHKDATIVTNGGQVYLQAAAVNAALAKIIQSGSIDTTGMQGGQVHVLADGGQIRVDGSIKANSTGRDDNGQSQAGGDIYIGRDKDTNVLAAVGDVSGAQLMSKGGFVETSGKFLKTDGISVKAKDWLLDPDNIDITGDATAATAGHSKIKASDIATALNAGTSVTVATTAANQSNQPAYADTAGTGAGSAVSGDGNILVNAAIVKSGANNASLTLSADNGITVNQRIGKASGDTTSTGNLNVTMTALGNAVTVTNSQGITLNNVIDANGGTVTLTGTNQNSGSGAGVRFANSSGISAGSYTINGTKLGTAAVGFGVWFGGTSTLTSSGNSSINGVSQSANGAFTAGLMFDDSTTVTLDAGAGSLVAKGSNAAYQTGVRIAANGNNNTLVTTRGNVTLGSNDSTSAGFVLRSGTLTADSGLLTILGKTNSNQHGVSLHDSTARIASNNGASIAISGSALANGWNGVSINGVSINAGTGDLLVNGSATNGNGVYIASAVTLSGRDITIDGSATTTTSGIGVRFLRDSTLNINATRNLAITGTVNGTGTGNGIHTGGGNVGTAVLMTAGGTATLRGIQRGNANNTASAVYLSGFRVNATGNVTLQAEAANSNSLAIHMNREAGALNGYDDGQRMQVRSSGGNVLIQSNQGAILGQDINGGVTISGRNVTLDNTGAGMTVNGVANANGGSIDATTGAIILGSGTSTYATTVANGWAGSWVPLGVSLANASSTANITASGNLTIGGSSSAAQGLAVGSAVSAGANIHLSSRTSAANTIGLNITQALTAAGSINLTGESTHTTTPGVGLNLGAAAITTGTNSTTTLASTTSTVSGTGNITTAAGNTGTITVNTSTAGTLSGVISGGGSLVKQGTGTTTLTGTNTYTGTTTISAGTLQIGSGSTTGTLGTGAVTNNTVLTFNRSDAMTVSNAIAGTGVVNQIGAGTTTLTADNSYGGVTTISAGVLQIGNSTTTGSLGIGGVTNNAALTFNRSNAMTVGNAIAGTGAVNQIGAGTTTLTADNSYGGVTTISGGTLQIGNGSATGSLGAGGVTNNAALTFNRSNAMTVGNAIAGTGAVNQIGAGTTTLTADNSYSGTTTISFGTLQVGGGGTSGTLGSGAASIASGSSLSFFRSNALTVGNAISGAGTLNFLGTGVQDQSDYALSASSSISGAINVSSSRLQISNSNQTGTAVITVNNGAGLVYTSNASTLTNALSLAGNGWNESSGYLGALRIRNGSNVGSAIALTANARIGAHNDSGTVSGVISGAFNLEFNTPAGNANSVVSLTNTSTYTGSTTVNIGTLRVGNGGATGSLGATSSVALVGGASLAFNRNTNTTIDKAIGGNGNVTANITGNLVMGSNVNLTGTNSINLTASGAITQTSGTLAATNLNMTSTSGAIGAAGQRVQTNVANLSVSAGGDVFVTEANAVTVSGITTANNGSFDIATSNGTMSIGSVNSIHGMTANGAGNITLAGNATTGHGISINNVITANNGNVNLTGTTASATNLHSGVFSSNTVTAKNITMVASATAASGAQLGYYGAGGNFDASQVLNLTGTTNSSGNGLYSYTGRYTSGTGMTLVGSSAAGQGMGFDAGVTVTNSTSGGITMTGTAADATRQAFGLRGVNMTNGGGNITMTATSGRIFSDAGNPVWGGTQTNVITNNGSGSVQITAGNASASSSGSIDGSVLTITQNANANVVVRTSGTGDVTAPKIVNAGTGDIVVAAGTAIAAGTGTGGQVLTLAGNTLTQTNASPGKTYVFSGAPESTGVLSNLTPGFSNLYYQGTSQPLNAAFNTGFDANPADNMSVPGGGSASNNQVFFRTAVRPAFSLTLANNSKTYGDVDPTTWVATNGPTLTNAVAGVGGSNTFAVSTANVLDGLTGGRVTGEDVGSYAYEISANNFNTTLTSQPNLIIGKRDITMDTLVASNRVYNGGAEATITSGTFGNLANGETLLISGSGLFDDKNAADGKTVTVADVSRLTKANGTGNWNNYNLTTTSKTTTANISKATLTATANNDARFVTQTDAANFNGVSLSGFVGGDTPADVNASGLAISRTHALSDTGAGHYVGVLVPTGLTSVNYNFSYVNGDYTIVPADRLLVRTSNQSLVYGTSPVFNTTAQYLDSRDNLIKTLTRTGTNNNFAFNDGAGTSISMSLKPYVGSNVAAQSTSGQTVVGSFDIKDLVHTQTGSNFVGVPVFVGRLDITPKAITPSASGVSKVYDGTTAMSNVVVGMTGKFADDVVRISGTGAFAQKDAGTGLFYAVSNVVLTGADAGNYHLANGTNSFSETDGVITRASLVATANSLNTTFNGAAQSVSGFTVSGLVSGDSVNDLVGISASGATATNVGSYANTMTLANQLNYTVTGVNGALVITPAPITVDNGAGGLTGTVSKVYDGTNSAVLSPANYVLTGWLGSDSATVTKTTGTYNNTNVGVGKPVTVSLSRNDFLATGATDLSNYSMPTSVTGAVGVITPKEVSLSSFTVADKVYDGSTLATITAGTVLTGVGSETLSVRGTGTFADKNVGDAKLVTPSDVSTMTKLDGSGSWLNYQLVNSNVTARASITPRPLQLSAQALDKRYDTTTGATIKLGGLMGLVGTEQLQVMAVGAFENAEVGTNKQVNVRFELGNGPNGGLGGNYSLAPQVLRASIIANPIVTPPVQPSPAPVTVQPARSAVTFAGTAFAAVGEQVSVQPSVVSCDLSNVEDCACEQSKMDHVLICYVPREVTATGRMLPNNTGASDK